LKNGTPSSAIPIMPIVTQEASEAKVGINGSDRSIVWAVMVLGLWSIWNAGSSRCTGNIPVVWSSGNALLEISR
jgi:hypothetical protein